MNMESGVLDSFESTSKFEIGESFVILSKLGSMRDAVDQILLLKEFDIVATMVSNEPNVDITFAGAKHNNQFEIYVSRDDFNSAKAVLNEESKRIANELPKDYYLYEFSNLELKELLVKFDEWGDADVAMARLILEERGKSFSQADIIAFSAERNAKLAKPKILSGGVKVLGFFLALWTGLVGIIIGYSICYSTKSLPNGGIVYIYSKGDRRVGKWMMVVGGGMFALIIVLNVWSVMTRSDLVFGSSIYTIFN
jgi:hypothetical protein